LDVSAVGIPAVDPPKPAKDDTGALPKSGGRLVASGGAVTTSGTLEVSGSATDCCNNSFGLVGAPNENGGCNSLVCFGATTTPNTEVVGAVSTSLTEVGVADDSNISCVVSPLKMVLLLDPVGGTPNNGDDVGL
jgi:hypothetical protein